MVRKVMPVPRWVVRTMMSLGVVLHAYDSCAYVSMSRTDITVARLACSSDQVRTCPEASSTRQNGSGRDLCHGPLKKDEWKLLVDLIQSAPAGPPPDSPFSCFRR